MHPTEMLLGRVLECSTAALVITTPTENARIPTNSKTGRCVVSGSQKENSALRRAHAACWNIYKIHKEHHVNLMSLEDKMVVDLGW